jgi:hypothetical protein
VEKYAKVVDPRMIEFAGTSCKRFGVKLGIFQQKAIVHLLVLKGIDGDTKTLVR